MGNQFLEVAVETAIEAGGILLAEFDRPVKISYKGEVDLVTQADRRSEEAIVSRLRRLFPQSRDRGRGRKRAGGPMHAIAGSSILSTAPPTSPTVIRVSRCRSDLKKLGNCWWE